MNLAEKLAAKRAAAAGLVPETKVADADVTDVVAKESAPVATVQEPVKQEPVPTGKLSFQERMALLKQQKSGTSTPAAIAPGDTTGTVTTSAVESPKDPVETKAEEKPKTDMLAHLSEATKVLAVAEKASRTPEQREALRLAIANSIPEGTSEEVAQAYTDIKYRIDELVEMSGEDLVNSMTELKKALMKNPSAVELMLDPDIGQMVIALRRMTNTALVEADKPKKAGAKAPKAVALTAEAMMLAFDEM